MACWNVKRDEIYKAQYTLPHFSAHHAICRYIFYLVTWHKIVSMAQMGIKAFKSFHYVAFSSTLGRRCCHRHSCINAPQNASGIRQMLKIANSNSKILVSICAKMDSLWLLLFGSCLFAAVSAIVLNAFSMLLMNLLLYEWNDINNNNNKRLLIAEPHVQLTKYIYLNGGGHRNRNKSRKERKKQKQQTPNYVCAFN